MITCFKLVKIISLHSLTRLLLMVITWLVLNTDVRAGQLKAGVGREDITSKVALKNDTLYVKALVLQDAAATAVIITVDAVAIDRLFPRWFQLGMDGIANQWKTGGLVRVRRANGRLDGWQIQFFALT